MSGNDIEGFICPYCLVSFGTSGKLQNHFVDMHSGQGVVDDYDVIDYVEDEDSSSSNGKRTSPTGHQFKVVRQSRPKSCDSCGEIIWQDGYVCQVCQVTVHTDNCPEKLTKNCTEGMFQPPSSSDQEKRTPGPGQNPKGLIPLVRRQVAKGRDRYVNDEFDLDLTYITERIIAMSFPASGVETAYRNNLKDVAKMLKTKHQENYMIFNLSERSYDISRFNNQVLDFGWPDHLAPSLERLSSVCKSIKSWLDSEPLHVAVVHCKGGKGRTGCVIAAFMHYTEICHSAAAALDRFAMKRFYDNKLGGVTQPSQRKYVHYFSDLLAGNIDIQSPPVVLQHVLLHGIPNFDGKGGCRVFLKIYENMKLVHTSGLFVCTAEKERLKISVYGGLKLQGEVLLKCFHKKVHTGMDSIFRCQFPSAVVQEDLRLVFGKMDLDDAYKDKRFAENIKVELIFGEPSDTDADAIATIADVRTSLLDSKQPQANGGTDLSHDMVANRDSYLAFPGGFDNGVSEDTVPDLMSHETPVSNKRNRTESSTSFNMDPDDIEHVTHRSQVYTVISKPFKKTERVPELKSYKSTQDTTDGGVALPVHGARNSENRSPTPRMNVPPSRPPPPSVLLRKMSADDVISNQLTKSNPSSRAPPPSMPPPRPPTESTNLIKFDDDYAEYAEVEEPSPSSSEGNSPLHRAVGTPVQIKQTFQNKRPQSSDVDLDIKNAGPNQPPKPSLAMKPSDIMRENKKMELHLKYSKIRDEKLKKEAAAGASGGGAEAKGSVANKRPRRPDPPHGHKPRYRPSYTEVEPDFEIRVEPLSNRLSQTDNDNMWMRVKYPTMPKRVDSLGQKSSSSSNLTGSEYYSNLAEMQLDVAGPSDGSGSESLGRRRHSFSEGDDKMIIRARTQSRSSGINISNGANSEDAIDKMEEGSRCPDYKNLQYNPDGTLNMEDSDSHAASFGAQIKMLGNVTGGMGPRSYENTKMLGAELQGSQDDDYMNDNPEGLSHIYSNQEDLLMQVHAENQPQPEEIEKALPLESSQRLRLGSGASILRFLKNNILKPKQPTEIHSSSIEEQRDRTLAPFAMTGVEIGRVNRDYEAFFKTSAWGGNIDAPKSTASSESSGGQAANGLPQPNLVSISVHDSERDENSSRAEKNTRQERPVIRPSLPIPMPKPRSKTTGDVISDENSGVSPLHSPQAQRRHGPNPPAKRMPLLPPIPVQLSERGGGHPRAGPPVPTSKPPSPPRTGPPVPTSKPPSPPPAAASVHQPLPLPRPHRQLQTSISDAPALPKPRLRDIDRAQSIEPPNVVRSKRAPPPKPPPPFQQSHSSADSNPLETQVRSLMQNWYKPKISREEAIALVLPMPAGSFVVRDSSTVKGGYALTLKINEDMVRVRKKLTSEDKVTDDMLVTHFLIQPDPVGVKLQGWSEKPFKSLAAFITNHSVEKLCLPCKLVLPEVTRRQQSGVAKAIQSGAACDLIYLGSVDVASAGSDTLLSQTVQQLQSLDLSAMNIVTITVSREGITLQENVNGTNLKRQYPFSLITYCGLEPVTRWNFPNMQHLGETITLTNKICFGIVHRPQNSFGYSCMVFAEYDSTQPVSSVVNFIHKMMREHKHSSKYNMRS